MKKYCVDCMQFVTVTITKNNIKQSHFNLPKVRKVLEKRNRVVVFCCKKNGAYYLNNFRVYELVACENFNDAGG